MTSAVQAPARRGPLAALVESLTGGSGWLMAGEAVNRGGRFLLLLLLARAVGLASYGDWFIAVATATIIANAGDLGLATTITRAVAANRASAVRWQALVFGVTPALVLLAIAFLLLATPLLVASTSLWLLLVLGCGGAFESAAQLVLSPLRGRERFVPEALVRGGQGATLATVGGAILLLGNHVDSVALVFLTVGIASAAFAVVAGARAFGVVRPAFDPSMLSGALRPALPVFASTLAFFLYFRIDAFMLARISGPEETGLYGAAYNVAFGASFLALMFGRATLPRLAAAAQRNVLRTEYRRAAFVTGVLAAALSLLLLLAMPLVLALYGDGFADARAPYALLVVAQAMYCFTHLNSITLAARGRTTLLWSTTMFVLVTNICVNAALIPALGAVGAALAMVTSEALLLAVQTVVVRSMLNDQQLAPAAPVERELRAA